MPSARSSSCPLLVSSCHRVSSRWPYSTPLGGRAHRGDHATVRGSSAPGSRRHLREITQTVGASRRWSWSAQAVVDGDGGGGGAVVHAELVVGRAEMLLHRAAAER